jgi:copper(I)-binding protein
MHLRGTPIRRLLLVALVVAACGGSAGPDADGSATVTVSDAWARAAAAGGVSAAYMTIANDGSAADALVGVSAPDVTASASLHETTTSADGMTGMQHTPSIAVPAGGTVALEPGGYHVMLMDLTKALAPGDTVTLTLTLEGAGTVTVDAEVREQ